MGELDFGIDGLGLALKELRAIREVLNKAVEQPKFAGWSGLAKKVEELTTENKRLTTVNKHTDECLKDFISKLVVDATRLINKAGNRRRLAALATSGVSQSEAVEAQNDKMY